MDQIIFHFINQFAFRWEWLDFLGVFFATKLEYLLWASLLIFLILRFKKYWKVVVGAVISGVISRYFIVEIIRFFWHRLRPFTDSATNLLVNKNNEYSFPSGHAAFYFAISTIIYIYNKKAGIAFYVGSLLIVLGRVFVGLHWPSDILVGAIIGILVALIINKLFKKYGIFFKRISGSLQENSK